MGVSLGETKLCNNNKRELFFLADPAMIAAHSVKLRSPRMAIHAILLTLRLMAAAALVACSGWAAGAADSYPDRPIKLVVASAVGSTPDVLARLIADGLSPRLGQGTP
jgi:hypothetical protein